MTEPPIRLDADGETSYDMPVVEQAIAPEKTKPDNSPEALEARLMRQNIIYGAIPMMIIVGACCMAPLGIVGAMAAITALTYGQRCDATMQIEGGSYENERIYDQHGKRVCTPQEDEFRSRVMISPNEEHIAFISDFTWDELDRSSAAFVANRDGTDLLVISPHNEMTTTKHVWTVRWIDAETIQLAYNDSDLCHYAIDGTFIGCEDAP